MCEAVKTCLAQAHFVLKHKITQAKEYGFPLCIACNVPIEAHTHTSSHTHTQEKDTDFFDHNEEAADNAIAKTHTNTQSCSKRSILHVQEETDFLNHDDEAADNAVVTDTHAYTYTHTGTHNLTIYTLLHAQEEPDFFNHDDEAADNAAIAADTHVHLFIHTH